VSDLGKEIKGQRFKEQKIKIDNLPKRAVSKKNLKKLPSQK
jgi:hypothetical protein